MSDKRYIVSAILPDGRNVQGTFRTGEGGRDVALSFEVLGRRLSARAGDYFEALAHTRCELEKDGILVNCYGASKNVYPSGMGRDMGAGLKAYRMTFGRQARKEDLVFIFDTGDDVEPATVSEQKEFFEAWLTKARR